MTEVFVFNTKKDGAEFFRSGETKETYRQRKVFRFKQIAVSYALAIAETLKEGQTIMIREDGNPMTVIIEPVIKEEE